MCYCFGAALSSWETLIVYPTRDHEPSLVVEAMAVAVPDIVNSLVVHTSGYAHRNDAQLEVLSSVHR